MKKIDMWNFLCEYSKLKFLIVGLFSWEISHVTSVLCSYTCSFPHMEFRMRYSACGKTNMKSHIWTFTHVKFHSLLTCHMWNFTCEKQVICEFHMWKTCHLGNTWVLRFRCVIWTTSLAVLASRMRRMWRRARMWYWQDWPIRFTCLLKARDEINGNAQ